MTGYQSVVSDASSRKRAYKEDEDVETTDDIFSAKFSYHLSRMHYHLPYSMCKKCITDFFADKARITYNGRSARVTFELCESCTRGNMKLSQVYGKYFTSK
ncbi:hypothetical protein AAVH_11354 [Aphelenchoides avenae]|nr:hypothetical protein AAVH_11354 [Aphelenchus avenae]